MVTSGALEVLGPSGRAHDQVRMHSREDEERTRTLSCSAVAMNVEPGE